MPGFAAGAPEVVDPGRRAASGGTDREVVLREVGLAVRVGSLAPPGPPEVLPGPDARPIPEFRLAELTRSALPPGPGGSEGAPDPRPVIRQVTDALVLTRGDRTEIALAPEELGRIRLVLSGPDRAQITLWVERPETLDLVRRNGDLLTQHLAEAGVRADSLDFRRDDRRGGPAILPPDPRERDEAQAASPALRVSLAPAPLSDRRIDIRI